MSILFLIDPNSIHDIKWAKYSSQKSNHNCFFICRKHHHSNDVIKEAQAKYNLRFLGTVDYFSVIRPIKTLQQLFLITSVIRKYQIDIFHIQYAEPNALWVLVKYLKNIKVVITCRGTDVLKTIPAHFAKKDFLNQIVKRLYKKAFQKVDWITVTSQKQMDSIQRFSGRENNFSIVRTGVEIDELQKDTSPFFREEVTKPFMLFPRYIKPLYNHEFCLTAINQLSDTIKNTYQMVFVGKNAGDMEYQAKLEDMMCQQADVDFVFLPKLEQQEIWEMYKRASLIVMTPFSDGSPVSAMEAIAMGKKLILGPLAYDSDIFNDQTAYQLQNWDANELKNLIKKTLTEKDTIRINIFSIIDSDANMKKVEAIYTQLLK